MLVKLKYLKVVKNINNDVYEWESLRQSIKTEGYDVKKYGMIHVKKFCNNNYLIIDGNHRVFLLKEIYDDEHEIEVKLTSYLNLFIKNKTWENFSNITFFIFFTFWSIWYFYTLINFIINCYINKLFIKK